MYNEPKPEESLLAIIKGLSSLPAILERMGTIESEVASLRKAMIPKPEKKWLTLKESAERLNQSTKTVRGYIERGFLRRNGASRHILIPAEDVEGFAKKVALN